MLVEINLLPQKEPRKFNILYLIIIIVLLALIGGFYFWLIHSAKSDIASVEQQIQTTKKIAEKTEKNAGKTNDPISASLLRTAVDWVSDYPIETIPVMNHLTGLLPERGFIQSFAYTEAGTVTISVQFDSAREAAYFLECLKESKWVKEASLDSLSVIEIKETTESAGQSNQTSSNSSNLNGQNTTNKNTDNQGTNNTNTANTENQTANSNATTSQNMNTTNTGTASKNNAAKSDKNILPRYLGQFQITFDKDAIKKDTEKSKKKEEGVTGS